jgi:hypothetical protein
MQIILKEWSVRKVRQGIVYNSRGVEDFDPLPCYHVRHKTGEEEEGRVHTEASDKEEIIEDFLSWLEPEENDDEDVG